MHMKGATVEWIDGNIGSKLTMKYPGIYLMGRKAYGETLSIAFARKESTPRYWCKDGSSSS